MCGGCVGEVQHQLQALPGHQELKGQGGRQELGVRQGERERKQSAARGGNIGGVRGYGGTCCTSLRCTRIYCTVNSVHSTFTALYVTDNGVFTKKCTVYKTMHGVFTTKCTVYKTMVYLLQSVRCT